MPEASSLPTRTTIDDVVAITKYLATKPMGATVAQAKAVLDAEVLSGRKLSAFKFWGLIEDVNGRFKLKELGRTATKEKGAHLTEALQEVISSVPAYMAVIERAVHKKEYTVTAVDVGAHWHDHFSDVASSNEAILTHQAVCFFQIAEGAGLGSLTVGRKGSPTRFEFIPETAGVVVDAGPATSGTSISLPAADEVEQPNDVRKASESLANAGKITPAALTSKGVSNNKVFITHGHNKKVLEQIKEIVAYGNYQPIVAQERESSAKPVPEKVMDDMRECAAAVIHVSAEGVYTDSKDKEHPKINDNVLIEIGAAMALYGRNFILVVEDGLQLPSNLQGLYECRYTGDELNTSATMKLLKAFKAFKDSAQAG
jgi:predicted nucleotide-binding protein